jgi:hypothetical protein
MSLKKLSEVKPENVREVSVPLEINQIKEFFENKELFFVVDYGASKIKGSMFLTYLSNLELPSEINLATASKTDKFDILKVFFETRNLCKSDVLTLTAAQVFVNNPLLSTEECQEFIEQNLELIKRWNTFIESCLVFLLVSYKDLNEAFKFSEQFEKIEDPQYVGTNVVQLFSAPAFMEHFYSRPAMSQPYYFKAQFEEYMFKGKNLFDYFACPENTIFGIFSGILDGQVTPKDMESLQGLSN